MSPVVLFYRVMAYVTGVLLVVLTFVGMPLKYLAGNGSVVSLVGFLHGMAYMVYLLAALLLSLHLRYRIGRMLLVMLAGTVPLASFYAERKVVEDVRRRQPDLVGTPS